MGACITSLVAARQQRIVVGFAVPDVGDDRQPYRPLVQRLGGRGPADAIAVLAAGMLGDGGLPPRRTTGKQLPNPRRETFQVVPIQLRAALRRPLPVPGAGLGVGQEMNTVMSGVLVTWGLFSGGSAERPRYSVRFSTYGESMAASNAP